MCGRLISTISQPAAFSQATPCCHSALISSDMPSIRYSAGTPMRRPLTDWPTDWVQSGVGMSRLVESLASNEHMDFSRMAASVTVLVIGPA
ncbi:hypothetical protein D3C75_931260 [compost metagenome]